MTNQEAAARSQTTRAASPVSNETLSRCADLLAVGEIGWPEGLSDEQELALVAEVRRCRRTRLIKFIASHIAADIAREREVG